MTSKKKSSFGKETLENLVENAREYPTDTEEKIRSRAYELYEQRGCVFGHDLDDWLQAESEVLGGKHTKAA
jgi:hypothetical protein